MATGRQRRSGGTRNGRSGGTATAQRSRSNQRRARDNDGIIPVLARVVRDIEHGVERNQLTSSHRTKFQVSALLAREERARVKADTEVTDAQRDGQLKRLDGIATILAQTAAREPSLFHLLDMEAEISDSARRVKKEMQIEAGLEPEPEPEPVELSEVDVMRAERKVVPASVRSAQLANPFMVPDFTDAEKQKIVDRRLAGWELITPLLNSFEQAPSGAPACMELPEPRSGRSYAGRELMDHQSKVLASVAKGHRTFLLADEPGLGKTAQALLAAQAADAYPLLCVVPNVVKTNWAREAQLWTPERSVSVVHGDGGTVNGFADIIIVNYEILDRHASWMSDHGFRGMVVDEAHFIKNKKSQRSQHVLDIAEHLRHRVSRPLLMALTGTPLINDIEDFVAIWEFLGWIEPKKPGPVLMAKLEESGMTPVDHGFYPAARQAVVDMGIVRRRKIDVASDIPARRIADMPVELDGAEGRSIRESERHLAKRLMGRYDAAVEARRNRGEETIGIDGELIRRVARAELTDESNTSTGENIFSMVRRIGSAKALLAADYAAQLSRSAGKVVFFAKHVDVMDAAQDLFESRGIGWASVRGEQSSTTRQKNIDAFIKDPDVKIIVCSLTAAGVGLNLQVASNVVLAELSWTDAEQTQAIDRVHRIGQAEPVTAWRVIAAQTVDAHIAELIDSKAGLAARALDGSTEEFSSVDVQLEALVALLSDALAER